MMVASLGPGQDQELTKLIGMDVDHKSNGVIVEKKVESVETTEEEDSDSLIARRPKKIKKSTDRIVQKSNLLSFLGIKKDVDIKSEDGSESLINDLPNSMIVKLKLPRVIVKLRDPSLGENSRVIDKPKSKGKSHPFFLKKSEKRKIEEVPVGKSLASESTTAAETGDAESPTSATPVIASPAPSHPFVSKGRKLGVGMHVTHDIAESSVPEPPPRSESAPSAPNHSFFMKRSAKSQVSEPPTTTGSSPSSAHIQSSDPEISNDSPNTGTNTSSITVTKLATRALSSPIPHRDRGISINFQPGIYPQWPKYLHTHSYSDDEFDSLLSIYATHSNSKAFVSKKQKRKAQPAVIPPDHDTLNIALQAARRTTPITLQKPTRIFLDELELQKLALSTISPSSKSILLPLINQCGKPSAFDDYSYETLTWTSKFAPTKAGNIITSNLNGYNVLSWIERKLKSLRKAPIKQPKPGKSKKRRKENKSEMDDFIVDEDDVTDIDSSSTPGPDDTAKSDFLILYGPPGSGKTSAVYASGAELGCYVFEVNSSQRRSGKNLMSLLEGMGQSHLVHMSSSTEREKLKQLQNSVVFLEEVDVLYEEEKSFWSGLEKFAEISRRPIILTCTNPASLPSTITDSINGNTSTYLEFHPASETLQADALFAIALCGGHLLPKKRLSELVVRNNLDFRLSLNNLQFWCQMGIGGRKSGIDWILASDEKETANLHGKRVISKGTYIQIPTRKDNADYDLFYSPKDVINTSTCTQPSISDWSYLYDTLSATDIIYSHSHTGFTLLPQHHLLDNSDNIEGIPLTEESSIHEQPLPFELTIYPELIDLITRKADNYSFPLLPSSPPTPIVDSITFKEALSYLGYRLDQWGTGIGQSNQFDSITTSTLATEIIPLVRSIARTDKFLTEQHNQIRSQLLNEKSTLRESRRSFAAMGIDNYERYLDGDIDLDEIINTAPITWSNN